VYLFISFFSRTTANNMPKKFKAAWDAVVDEVGLGPNVGRYAV
jgi:hypothetical protein